MKAIFNVIGIVNLVEHGRLLEGITENRPLATVPFGARYRLIDFVLSGMTNSGIADIGILTPRQYHSLLDHLRMRDGNDRIMLLPSSFDFAGSDADHLSANLGFLHKSWQEYVLMANANVVSNFDFRRLFQFHRQTRADITLLYKRESGLDQDCLNCVLIDVQPDRRVTGIRVNPRIIDGNNFFLGVFMLKKSLLFEILTECLANKAAGGLLQEIGNNLRRLSVYACHYNGYLARIHCVSSYYRHNMLLLNPVTWRQLFAQPRPIYTKLKDDAPTRYFGQAKAANALIAGGCRIAGTVENSILFRNVSIGEEAHVKDSILMPNTKVSDKACLEYVICDKDVVVKSGRRLQGQKDKPIILQKGTVI